MRVRSLGWENSWRSAWQPIPVFLPGESHGQRILAGHSPQGRIELDTTIASQHAHSIWFYHWKPGSHSSSSKPPASNPGNVSYIHLLVLVFKMPLSLLWTSEIASLLLSTVSFSSHSIQSNTQQSKLSLSKIDIKSCEHQKFSGSLVIKTSPSKSGGSGPNWGSKIPHATWPKNQSMKQKLYYNKFNKDLKNVPYQKKKKPKSFETQLCVK